MMSDVWESAESIAVSLGANDIVSKMFPWYWLDLTLSSLTFSYNKSVFLLLMRKKHPTPYLGKYGHNMTP